jgi:hypothetical protein
MGMYSPMRLPRTASPEQLIARIIETTSFAGGKVKTYQAAEVRMVRISGVPYTAVLIETNVGRKIVLLRYEEHVAGWWSRIYDVKR